MLATAPRIFLGDCERARAKELDVTALKRDGFYRAVIEGDLYILGRDNPEPRWHRGGWVEFARLQYGTINGVYDLLEDYFSKFYGPAGDAIQALYARLEEDWKRIMTFYPEPPSAHNRWIAGPLRHCQPCGPVGAGLHRRGARQV